MLGGCSSINAQMAQYGDPGDFDSWAEITGDDSWSWEKFSPYFRKFERFIPDPEQPDIDKTQKGSDGPVRVGYFSYISEASKAFVKACVNLKIPFSHDFNTSSHTIGVNRIMTYIDDKRARVTSETSYLTPDVLARPNLKVAIHATVTKIIFEKNGGETRAVAVEFAKNKNGPVYRARARQEIIVCGGAIHSPQILLLSGVGPAEHLKEHKIEVVKDLPGVGSNLVDHPVVNTFYKDIKNSTPKYFTPSSLWDIIQILVATIRYLIFRTGPMTTNWGEAAAFIRSDDPILFPPAEYSKTLTDSTTSPKSPDLEIFTTGVGYTDHGRKGFKVHTFGVHCCLVRPLSSGTLRLKSSSVWDHPLIDPRYLESQDDVEKLVRGIKLCVKLAHTEPLKSLVDHDCKLVELDQEMHLKSDEELEKIVRNRVETLYHPASTCRMAPLEKGGVLDAEMRVYGIQGLRVADASAFPTIVSGHTAGAVLAIAERLSDILKTRLAVAPVAAKEP